MVLYGTNTIKACLEAKTLIKVMMTKEFSNKFLINSLKESRVKIEYVSKEKLNEIAPGNNQGIAALVKDIYPVSLNEVIALTKKQKEKGEVPLVIILDSLTDPHNLGAVLRSADAFDAKAVIYKKHGSVSLNATVAKVSTGAINFVKCAEVTNLTRAIETLKENGFWVIGLDGGSKSGFKDVPSDVPLAIVVGSEGYGISRLVKENCDLIVSIPMIGRVNCLNASVACSIALYALRNR